MDEDMSDHIRMEREMHPTVMPWSPLCSLEGISCVLWTSHTSYWAEAGLCYVTQCPKDKKRLVAQEEHIYEGTETRQEVHFNVYIIEYVPGKLH